MTHIEYFKLQAKNLFRDYKTKKPYIDNTDGNTYYEYSPKYFDVDGILLDYDYDEDDFSLMKAQHIIALMAGFKGWAYLLKASPVELELAKLLFNNQDKINNEEWEMYISHEGYQNKTYYDSKAQLEIFKQVFLNADGHRSMFSDYRLNVKKYPSERVPSENNSDTQESYKELTGKAKQTAIDKQKKAGLGFESGIAVECLHCGKNFLFKEAKAIKLISNHTHNPMTYIVCKSYPECNGTLIDFVLLNSKGEKDEKTI